MHTNTAGDVENSRSPQVLLLDGDGLAEDDGHRRAQLLESCLLDEPGRRVPPRACHVQSVPVWRSLPCLRLRLTTIMSDKKRNHIKKCRLKEVCVHVSCLRLRLTMIMSDNKRKNIEQKDKSRESRRTGRRPRVAAT